MTYVFIGADQCICCLLTMFNVLFLLKFSKEMWQDKVCLRFKERMGLVLVHPKVLRDFQEVCACVKGYMMFAHF